MGSLVRTRSTIVCRAARTAFSSFSAISCRFLRFTGFSMSIKKEVAAAAVGDIRHFSGVDAVGVCYDPALRCLTENPGQAHSREAVRFNEVPQDISRPHARKLVDITDQYEGHSIRDRFQKIVEENSRSIMEHSSTMSIALEEDSPRFSGILPAVSPPKDGEWSSPPFRSPRRDALRRGLSAPRAGSWHRHFKPGDNAQGRCCLAGARSALSGSAPCSAQPSG